MARYVETVVFVIDLSRHTHKTDLENAILAVEQDITAKFVHNPKDEVAIIVVGTPETKNSLNSDLGGYEGVAVVCPWDVVSTEALQSVHALHDKERAQDGDLLNAIVVAMDVMFKAKGTIAKGKKKIVLLTSGVSPLEASENTSAEVDALRAGLEGTRVRLEVILLPYEQDKISNYNREANIKLLKQLMGDEQPLHIRNETSQVYQKGTETLWETSLGRIHSVSSSHELLFRFWRRVLPSTSYRGDLEISPDLRIPVWGYKKTKRQRMPSLKMCAESSSAEGHSGMTHAVKRSSEYRLRSDKDVVVRPQELIRAYKYGQELIPVSDAVRAAFHFESEKGIKVLGFTPRETVPRQEYQGEVSIFMPAPGCEVEHTRALSALARAMERDRTAMVARCKLTNRKGSKVVLAAFTPALSPDRKAFPDALYCNTIPFADDVREFKFLSLQEHPKRRQPTDAQLAAAEDLVRAMDLGPTLGVKGSLVPNAEILVPEEVPSPSLQGYQEIVRSRLLKEASESKQAVPRKELPRFAESLPWAHHHGIPTKKTAAVSSALATFKEVFSGSLHGKNSS